MSEYQYVDITNTDIILKDFLTSDYNIVESSDTPISS